MSSIDEVQKKRLIHFFRSNIQTLELESMNEESDNGVSCYRRREWKPLTPQDFEIALDDAGTIGSTLDAFWAGSPIFGLGKRLAKLIKRLQCVKQKSEVSPSVYEMF